MVARQRKQACVLGTPDILECHRRDGLWWTERRWRCCVCGEGRPFEQPIWGVEMGEERIGTVTPMILAY